MSNNDLNDDAFFVDFDSSPHAAPPSVPHAYDPTLVTCWDSVPHDPDYEGAMHDDVIGVAGLERALDGLVTAMTVVADISIDEERHEETRQVAEVVYAELRKSYEWLNEQLIKTI